MFVITLNGSIELKILRQECNCHDLIDELLFNGIFPGNPVLPSNFLLIVEMGFDFKLLDLYVNLQTSCSISEDAFIKLLDLNSKSNIFHVLYLPRNLAFVSDNYRYLDYH